MPLSILRDLIEPSSCISFAPPHMQTWKSHVDCCGTALLMLSQWFCMNQVNSYLSERHDMLAWCRAMIASWYRSGATVSNWQDSQWAGLMGSWPSQEGGSCWSKRLVTLRLKCCWAVISSSIGKQLLLALSQCSKPCSALTWLLQWLLTSQSLAHLLTLCCCTCIAYNRQAA